MLKRMLMFVNKETVLKAIKEFDDIKVDAMLKNYGGGESTRWYIHYNGEKYDQKLICRAAIKHRLQELGQIPAEKFKFKVRDAKRKLEKLGFDVKE